MGVFETFAKRKRERARAGQVDVYQYDAVPTFLRTQVSMILMASLGPWWTPAPYSIHPVRNGNENWHDIARVLERECEAFPSRNVGNAAERCLTFLGTPDVDDWLSLVECACLKLSLMARQGNSEYIRETVGAQQRADDALDEINDRFREAAFGYEFRNGMIIRVDDEFIHAEVVRPALQLLGESGFAKANEDFMEAHRHYREGSPKDAVVAANRAFESTLKAICAARKWKYPDGARASELVTTVRNKGLFPDFLGAGMDTYVALMKTGLPGVRNNAGGHGEDPGAPPVPMYLASYAIHLTATNILLVINAYKKKQG